MKHTILQWVVSLLVTIPLLWSGHSTTAQTPYRDSTFSAIKMATHTYANLPDSALKFDFYRAEEATGRLPLVVVVHGGGFVSGARDSEDMAAFSTRLAQWGYAVAAVSYRLTMKGIGFGCDVDAPQKIEAINSASDDVSLAVKYILDREDQFLIDQSKIVLFGSSAGAETILNLAYVYDNGVLPDAFQFAGLISLAGAMVTLKGLDATTAIPSQFFHGTGDELVPYDVAPHHYCNGTAPGFLMLYGSQAIAERVKGAGKSYYLYSVKGGSHSWATLPMTEAFEEMIDFLYQDVISNTKVRYTERTIDIE